MRVEKQIGSLSEQFRQRSAQNLAAIGGVSDQIAQSHHQLRHDIDTVKSLTEAVQASIKHVQNNLKQQTHIMLDVMRVCENIHAGQSDMQQRIMQHQTEIMHAIINSTKAEVASGVGQLIDFMQTQRIEQRADHTIQVVKTLEHHLKHHLADPCESPVLAIAHSCCNGQHMVLTC